MRQTLQTLQLQNALQPLREYLDDPQLVELMVNPDGHVWIERQGQRMEQTPLLLASDYIMQIIRLLASAAETECHEDAPDLSTVIPETGERFQGMIPPASDGPGFVIRKPAIEIYTLAEYVAQGVCTGEEAQRLWQAVEQRENILIGGGTGSGKSTLANTLLTIMSGIGQRLVTIEDTAELRQQRNHFRIYTKLGVFTMQQGVQRAMRLRPDRVIVGEVRGPEALDVLDAWNTGHPGGLCTVHTNSLSGILTRMESLVHRANIPREVARELLVEAAPLCVYMERTAEGRQVRGMQRVIDLDGGRYVWD